MYCKGNYFQFLPPAFSLFISIHFHYYILIIISKALAENINASGVFSVICYSDSYFYLMMIVQFKILQLNF
jgi:hypothetical protein